MVTKEKLARINELAAKAKTAEGLTEAELAERDTLRKEYLANVRGHIDGHLHNITVVDESGRDVTPEKLKVSKINRRNKEENEQK